MSQATLFKLLDGYVEPSPRNELRLLFRSACRIDNYGRGVRAFLFWLESEVPPDGTNEEGGAALLGLPEKQRDAVLAVPKWWMTHGRNPETLVRLLDKIRVAYAKGTALVQPSHAGTSLVPIHPRTKKGS